jgi:hypothetical protein
MPAGPSRSNPGEPVRRLKSLVDVNVPTAQLRPYQGVCLRSGRCPRLPHGRGLSFFTVLGVVLEVNQQTVDLLFELRQVVFCGGPKQVDVDVKVIVNHPIAHARI